MNLRNLLQRRPSRRFRARHTAARRQHVSQVQRLESRALLVGNVTATLAGSHAIIEGDAADNSVELLLENGSLILRGQDGTSINGSANDFVVSAGDSIDYLTTNLHGGNDRIVLDKATVNQTADIIGGAGNDELVVSGQSVIDGSLIVRGQSGDDSISVQGSTVVENLVITGGTGNDLLIMSGTTVGQNTAINGGSGNNRIMIDGSDVTGRTSVVTYSGNDDVVFRNSNLFRTVTTYTGAGDDTVLIDNTVLSRRNWMFTDAGNDNIMIDGGTVIHKALRIYLGTGTDNVETGSVFFRKLRRRNLQTRIVDTAVYNPRITDSMTGLLANAQAFVAQFGSELSLTVSNASVSEGAGSSASTLAITRTGDTDQPVEITLTSSDTNKLQLEQSVVTIPANQASVNVLLNAIDNQVVDGTTTVTITASAPGFTDQTLTVDVTDNDGDTLTITSSQASILEDSGNVSTIGAPNSFTYTVTRSNTVGALTVDLSADIPNEVNIPATVSFTDGQATANVNATTTADGNVENDIIVTVTASAAGQQSGSVPVTIIDNDSPRLDIAFSLPSLTETGPSSTADLTITRNTDTTNPLTVTLTSSDTNSLTVPATAEIPAGQSSVTVSLTAVNETIDDGDVSVSITAAANGFTSGSGLIIVRDDDVPTLTLSLPAGNSVSEAGGTGALTVTATRNSGDTSAPLDVTLNLAGDSRLTGPSSVTIPAGQSSVDFTLDAIDDNIVNQPADGSVTIVASATGFNSADTTVTVTDNDVATIILSPTSQTISELAGNSETITLSRTDSGTVETIGLSYGGSSVVSGPSTVDFAIGVSSIDVPLTVTDNPLFSPNAPVTITASAPGHPNVTATVEVTNDENLTLMTDISSNNITQSSGTVITRDQNFTVAGVTAVGATVEIDADGDGQFDDGSAVASNSGNFSIDVSLLHDATNNGANQLNVRAIIPVENISVTELIDVHYTVGTVVRFELNQDLDSSGQTDFFDVELLDAAAPVTTQNFISYTTTAATGTERFDNLLLQRLAHDFVIQAGRFNLANDGVTPVELDRDADNDGNTDTIINENDPNTQNLRGTLALALPAGNPNGGSSEWFINTTDNAFLSDPSRAHTVFGRVIGTGMTVVDNINPTPVYNLNDAFNSGALGTVPLLNSPFATLSGTVTTSNGSSTVTGVATAFSSELSVGDTIVLGTSYVQVTAINSDTELTISSTAVPTLSNTTAQQFAPRNEDYLIFTNIGVILDRI